MYRQSFAWWSFVQNGRSDLQLLSAAAGIGYHGVDFLPQNLWSRARDLGLTLAIIDGHKSLEVGFNSRNNHAGLAAEVRQNLSLAFDSGALALAVNAGNRDVASDSDAIDICAEGLAPLATEADGAGLTLLLEPLNSTVDHPHNQCDHTEWAAAVVDRVGSPGLRLLYDAYHMQIMEGNLLETIAANLDRIAHIHTAGVPGRRDLDQHQEVNWIAIATSLRRQRFTGFVAHEFIPRADPIAALRAAYDIFDVDRS